MPHYAAAIHESKRTTMLPAKRKHVLANACVQKEATVTAGRIAGLEAVRIIR